MRLREFYKSRRAATSVRSILFVTVVSSALYYYGSGPFRNGCDERTVTFAPEEAIFAPKASSTRVQTRDVCAEPREHLGKSVRATVADTEFDMFVYGGGAGIKDIVSDSIAGSGSWERLETEKLMSTTVRRRRCSRARRRCVRRKRAKAWNVTRRRREHRIVFYGGVTPRPRRRRVRAVPEQRRFDMLVDSPARVGGGEE